MIRQGESALAFATANNLPDDTFQCQILQISLLETTGRTESVASLCQERRAERRTKRQGTGETHGLVTFAQKRWSE